MSATRHYLACTLAVFSLVFAGKVEAQNVAKSRSFRLLVGSNRLLTKDYFHSPYTYRGIGWQAEAAYEQEKNNRILYIGATYGRGAFQSVVSAKARNQLIDLDIGYLRRLGNQVLTARGLTCYLGGALKGFGLSTRYAPDLQQSKTQVTLSTSLNIAGRAVYQFRGPHQLAFGFYASLAAVIYRPDYLFNGKDQTSITWPGNSRIVGAQLHYQYDLAINWQMVVAYHCDYFDYKQPQPIYLLRQSLHVGLKKAF